MKLSIEKQKDAIAELKHFYGLPPFEGSVLFASGQFAIDLEKKYAMSVKELEVAVNFKVFQNAWADARREFSAIDMDRLNGILLLGFNPFDLGHQMEVWCKAHMYLGSRDLKKKLAVAGFSTPKLREHLKALLNVLK